MQDQGKKVKINHAMEALGQVVKKSGEVPMPRNGFGNFEQGFELAPRMFERRCAGYFGRGDSGIRHRVQNSIRVGRGSTKRTGISETAEATLSPTRVYYFRVVCHSGIIAEPNRPRTAQRQARMLLNLRTGFWNSSSGSQHSSRQRAET
jgi:hypothetical protein